MLYYLFYEPGMQGAHEESKSVTKAPAMKGIQ